MLLVAVPYQPVLCTPQRQHDTPCTLLVARVTTLTVSCVIADSVGVLSSMTACSLRVESEENTASQCLLFNGASFSADHVASNGGNVN